MSTALAPSLSLSSLSFSVSTLRSGQSNRGLVSRERVGGTWSLLFPDRTTKVDETGDDTE